MKKASKWFWILIAGIVGGFAFAIGSALADKAESKVNLETLQALRKRALPEEKV